MISEGKNNKTKKNSLTASVRKARTQNNDKAGARQRVYRNRDGPPKS